MIDIKGIRKSFGHLEVLKGIDLHINKGEVVSIVGPSGAGKTTLLNLIYEYYTKYQASSHKISVSSVYHATETLIPVAFIRSFDVPSNAKKNTNSPLYETLSKVVLSMKFGKLN